MIRAAGILFLTKDGSGALFCKRGNGASNPGEWACPGGHIEDGETPIQAAIRETMEEAGIKVDEKDLTLLCRSIANAEVAAGASSAQLPEETGINPAGAGLPPTDAIVVPGEQVDFTTFLCRVPEAFLPKLNYEHTGFAWASLDTPPEPLHPGMRLAIERMTMDELGIARAMTEGRLPSPQRYQNVTLWNMRITGTGVSYRPSLNEFVYRPPEHYLNPDFLARIGGLSAIVEHPDAAVMDSKEFSARVVGSLMIPYIKAAEEEVWGIVRVYDDWTNAALEKEDASTSPTVLLRQGESTKMKLEDGSTLLMEGAPALVDHIAILPFSGKGVWDKAGPPVGVDRSGVEAHADSAGNVASANLRKLMAAGREIALLSARMSNRAAAR
jgi:8-oxo-dGTP pyrophosphatase MutT (NUDIX family)